MSESNVKWTNITGEFRDACKELQIGELFKEPNFGLFEAMSAIEMMDPKMDAGLASKKKLAKVTSIADALERKVLKLDNIESKNKLYMMDVTYCHLLTWLDGTSMAQTLFTNLYFHVVNDIQDKTVKWFCISILKLVASIRAKIMSATVYEEEDIQLIDYGFKFANDVTESACVTALKSVEDETAKTYRNLKSQPETRETKAEMEYLLAIQTRLKFNRSFYQLVQLLTENARENEEDVTKYFSLAKDNLRLIESSHKNLGLHEPTSAEFICFEPSINQRLLPPTFPRHINIQSFENSVAELAKIIDQVPLIIESFKLTNYHSIFDFLNKFGEKKQSVLSRSALQLILLPENSVNEKMNGLKEMLKSTIRQFVNPPSLQLKSPLASKDFCKSLVDTLMAKCAAVFLTLTQIMGNNRARQREKLGHILEDFAVLQEHADNVDRALDSYMTQSKMNQSHVACYGSWLLHNSLSIMILYLLHGFELELYSIYEYHYIYWYLNEVLLNWHAITLNRVENLINSMAEMNLGAAGANKNAKKVSKKKKSAYERELTMLYAHRHMCSALYQALRAFKLQGAIKEPSEEFSDEELRYTHRFAPFRLFTTPPICVYRQFADKDAMYLRSVPPERMFANAQDHFDKAKGYYEELGEWNFSSQCAKVAKTNFVVMRLLSSGLKKPQKVEFDFTTHPHFPIIRIQ